MTFAAAYFYVFPAAGLVPATDRALGFLGLGVFLVSKTLGFKGVSITAW